LSVAARILKTLGPYAVTVGVFRNQPEQYIRNVARMLRLSAIQLHGREPASLCSKLKKECRVVKAVFPDEDRFLQTCRYYKGTVDAFLLDVDFSRKQKGARGFAWKDVQSRYKRFFTSEEKIIISGNLTPRNVPEAIALFNPYAVDVTSGVESSVGKKDARLVREFIRRAKPYQCTRKD